MIGKDGIGVVQMTNGSWATWGGGGGGGGGFGLIFISCDVYLFSINDTLCRVILHLSTEIQNGAHVFEFMRDRDPT